MCGRTACPLPAGQVSRACTYRDRRGRRTVPAWRDGDATKYRPSFNKSPSTFCPVLVSKRHFCQDAEPGERVLAAMRWGLVPLWSREPTSTYNMNNCRSDTMTEKKSYQGPLNKGQRCVVVADGFFEWHRGKTKQPYFIYAPENRDRLNLLLEAAEATTSGEKIKMEELKEEVIKEGKVKKEEEVKEEVKEVKKEVKEEERCGVEEVEEWRGWRPLTMAGLFECWQGAGAEEPLYTFTVITVDASPTLAWLHHRMPAILEDDDAVRRWLDFGTLPGGKAALEELVRPSERVAFHAVSTFVNNSRNNSPECVLEARPHAPATPEKPKPKGSSLLMMNWLKKSEKKEETSPLSTKSEPQENDDGEEEEEGGVTKKMRLA